MRTCANCKKVIVEMEYQGKKMANITVNRNQGGGGGGGGGGGEWVKSVLIQNCQ